MSSPFATTGRAGLRPLGTSDQRVYETIASEAERALGPAHAAVFAEPEYLRRTASSDWYSSVEGVITPLADMSEADAAHTERRLSQLLGDISRHASELKEQGSDADRRLGAALEQAVLYPSDSSIFGAIQADGSIQPILVDWAHKSDVVPDRISTLIGMAPGLKRKAPPQNPEPPIAPKAPPPWWWWFVLLPMWMFAAGSAVVLIWLLIEPCGIALGPWANACPREAVAQANQPMRYRAVLEQQEADLRRQIAEAERACLPPEAEPVPETEAEPGSETDRRLEEAEAATGDLEITLTWEDKSDLDIAVECPTGDKINFRKTVVAACRGKLDVDMNNIPGNITSRPVEHVVFTDPLPGAYTITVTLFDNRPPPETHAFTVRIKSAAGSETLSGSVSPGRKTWTRSITFP